MHIIGTQKWRQLTLITVLLCFHPPALLAEDRVDLDTLTIKGQKAVPALVFNIPWQRGEPPRLKALTPTASAPLQPIEREDFMLWQDMRANSRHVIVSQNNP